MKAVILIAVAASLFSPAARAGLAIGYDDGGAVLFRIAAPDGWRVDTGFATPPEAMPDGRTPTPRVVSLLPPDDDVVMWTGLWSPPNLATIADLPDRQRPPLGGRPNRPVTLPAHVGPRPRAGGHVGRGGGARHRRC